MVIVTLPQLSEHLGAHWVPGMVNTAPALAQQKLWGQSIVTAVKQQADLVFARSQTWLHKLADTHAEPHW